MPIGDWMNKIDLIYMENSVPEDDTDVKAFFWQVKRIFRENPDEAIKAYITYYNLSETERVEYVKDLEQKYAKENITKDNEWIN